MPHCGQFFYKEPWWRALGKSANIMSTVGAGGYTACMDHSAYDAQHTPALMCWLEGATNL